MRDPVSPPPGAVTPLPLKEALYHHKEALSLPEKPGCCHGDRGGLEEGGPLCGGKEAFQAEGTGVHRPVATVGDGCAARLQPSAWPDSCPAVPGGAVRTSHGSLFPSVEAGLPGPGCCGVCLGLVPTWLCASVPVITPECNWLGR